MGRPGAPPDRGPHRARLDITAALAAAVAAGEDDLLVEFLSQPDAQAVSVALLFDHLDGAELTALERLISRIEATGSPTFVTVDQVAVRAWLAKHCPDPLDALPAGYGS